MTKVYVCPYCGARGTDILRQRVTSFDAHMWFDAETGEMYSYIDDWYETHETYCIACDEELDGSPSDYMKEI